MLNSIQMLRAIAAWMVVGHHIQQIYFNFQATGWPAIFFSHYGAMGVDIFFVISGFVIFDSTREKTITPVRFMAYRLIRIVPAYWFYSLAASLLVYCYSGLLPLTGFSVPSFVNSLLFIPSLNPSGIGYYPLLTVGWTLNFEMMFYLVFCIALFGPGKYRLYWVAIGLVILQAILPKIGSRLEFYNNHIVYEFLYGVMLGVLHSRKWTDKINPLMAIALICAAIAIITNWPNIIVGSARPVYVGIPCALIVAALLALEKHIPACKPLIHLGGWSYSTYLSHVILIAAAHKAAATWQIGIPASIVAACALIVAASYLSFTFIESTASSYFKKMLAPAAIK